ncbi:hypothetical protein CTRI78_v007590 [Colletotrichum trifolii]|uniref:Uncharacterized protein n=1 Tax=Colletotrichum trifolii TaxID=5466 RepID=A0A4R8R6F2_COLTR|nr:hypothetical protein CTRI78_v007590 [Colletotrichum trifolii]
MKLSLFFLATLALGANAANYLCWCTVDGYYSEYYTKLSCWRKYKKYLKYSDANSRDECWRKPSDTLTDWTEGRQPGKDEIAEQVNYKPWKLVNV